MFSNYIFLIIINIIFSILFIYGCHYLWNILKDTYSKRKTKDLVNTQIKKYQKMMNEIQSSQGSLNSRKNTQSKNEINTHDINKMDIELSDFIMNEL
jgi:hypothetical protein